jgi:hypothetical protein
MYETYVQYIHIYERNNKNRKIGKLSIMYMKIYTFIYNIKHQDQYSCMNINPSRALNSNHRNLFSNIELDSFVITKPAAFTTTTATPTTMASESEPLVAKQQQPMPVVAAVAPLSTRLMDVVRLYWFLGLIAFGGPSAHVAILRDHLCVHNNWIDEESFMELFALCVGLPGPSSTQLVIATAVTHAGPLGGMIAFVFWNLPGEYTG